MNDFHASLTHNHNDVGRPNGGLGVTVASQGFVTGPGTPGIVVLAPQFEGVENLVFNTFTMGVTITGVNQTGDTLHLADAVSKVWGAHTLKFGGRSQFQQVRLEPNATFNGTFTFAGTETGFDFTDFLLGVPSNYIQSSGGIFYLRNQYGGVFAQDSWRARSNVTINYGLRWDIMAPWYKRDNQIQTIVANQQSAVYPGAPLGLVFPGDTGIARGLSPARFGNLSPGSAWRTRRTTRRACAPATGCSTARSRAFPPASCTASAVRLQLSQPRSAAVRHAVHHRG